MPALLDLEAVQDTDQRDHRVQAARPLGRNREIELLGSALPRARLLERAGAGDELLRERHQPARRADPARLRAPGRSGALRLQAPGLDDRRGRSLVDSRSSAGRSARTASRRRHDLNLVTGRPPIARRGAPWGIADTELRRKAEPGSAVSSTGEWL